MNTPMQEFPPETKADFHRWRYGGDLRKSRFGRGRRPLSTKYPIHLVFKVEKLFLPKGLRAPGNFLLVTQTVRRYAFRFKVGVEKISIQHDHIHLLVRSSKMVNYHAFFRVVAGQIAQKIEVPKRPRKTKYKHLRLWKHRPFSRIVWGERARQIVRNYIQLNEMEVLGRVRYRKQRLRGLKPEEIEALWHMT
jgi:REP element-mobilizing transposase RayT